MMYGFARLAQLTGFSEHDLRRFRGEIVVDVMRTHPLIIIGGILQENPFFAPPDEFLEQLRERGTARIDQETSTSQVRGEHERTS